MFILSQEVKIQGDFNKFLSYYCIRVTELLKLLAIENCYSLPLMLNLMYTFQIRKATLLMCIF